MKYKLKTYSVDIFKGYSDGRETLLFSRPWRKKTFKLNDIKFMSLEIMDKRKTVNIPITDYLK